MTELKLYGLTPEELEAARESLVALYELRDEYAKAIRAESTECASRRAPCIDCFDKCQCFAKWAQMPYEDEEGGAK